MSSQPNIKDFNSVLAVEGYSDLLFYAEVLEFIGKKPAKKGGVFIKEFNGASDMMTKLEAFLSPGLLAEKSVIGIILDADVDASSRIDSLSRTLEKLTGRSLQHGEWSDGQPKLGFFVVPDGQQDGEIETLAWNSWANDVRNDEPRKCIDSYLDCMNSVGLVAQSPDKARIGALLSVKSDEDPRLGPGARRGHVFDFTRPEFQPLIDFLRGM